MGTVAENLALWDGRHDWGRGGEEWSDQWGGSEAQWYGTLLPRVRAFLPAKRILEIAPGHGRWTRFLADHCDTLVGVDLAGRCVEACRERFADDPRLEFHANDGLTLPMVPDASIDFAFSFDSLVHAEADVVHSYLGEIRRVLRPGGHAFLHHSNIGEYLAYYRFLRDHPRTARLLRRLRLAEAGDHWHAWSMTARRFRGMCRETGLACPSQELVNWICHPKRLIGCFSLVRSPPGGGAVETRVTENPGFGREIVRAAELERLFRRGE